MKLAHNAVHVERLAAAGRTQTEKITVVGQFLRALFSCDVDSHRHALPVRVIYLQRSFLAMQDAFLVHQTGCRITQGKETVIVRIHTVTVARKGVDEQLQLVVGSFGNMDAHP